MKRRAHICILFFIGIALSVSAGVLASDTSDMPYREIASRNSFGLKARPEKPKAPPVVSLLPKIRLAGITTILGRKTAFLVIAGSEPGGLPECFMFAEGQRQHDTEVIEIDAKRGTVKILNCGQEEILDFSDDDVPPGVPQPIPHCPGSPFSNINPVPNNLLSPEEQTVLIEAQRLKALQDGDPAAKILPPTEHTQEIVDQAAH